MRRTPAVGTKKKTYSPSEGRARQGDHGHKEVDLVPIMNLFVTIIPLLLQMVVLVTIAYVTLDLTTPQAGGGTGSESNEEETPKEITDLELVINVGEDNKEFYNFVKNGEIDTDVANIPVENMDKLADALRNYRSIMFNDLFNDNDVDKHKDKQLTIQVFPKDYVEFGTFVKTMDLCKKLNFGDIILKEIK